MRPLSRRAFTLVELLVVIAIIILIVAILLPAVQKVREAAARAKCLNNLRQIGIGMSSYQMANGSYPAAVYMNGNPNNGIANNPVGQRGPTWAVMILPHIEEGPVYQSAATHIGDYVHSASDPDIIYENTASQLWTNTPTGAGLVTHPVKLYRCPSDPHGGTLFNGRTKGNYAGNGGTGMWQYVVGTANSTDTRANFIVHSSGSPVRLRLVDDRSQLRNNRLSIIPNIPPRGNRFYTFLGPTFGPYETGNGDPGMQLNVGGVMSINRGSKLSSIRDSASSTVLVAEVLTSKADNDPRGVWSIGTVGSSIIAGSGSFWAPGPNPPLLMGNAPTDLVAGCGSNTDPTQPGFVPASGPPCRRTTDGGPLAWPSRSMHPGGVQMVFCDGSAKFVSDRISTDTYFMLFSRADGKSPDLD